VPVDLVVGKVFVLLWPADRFRWDARPATFEDVPDPSS
jgi:signal peptidase I